MSASRAFGFSFFRDNGGHRGAGKVLKAQGGLEGRQRATRPPTRSRRPCWRTAEVEPPSASPANPNGASHSPDPSRPAVGGVEGGGPSKGTSPTSQSLGPLTGRGGASGNGRRGRLLGNDPSPPGVAGGEGGMGRAQRGGGRRSRRVDALGSGLGVGSGGRRLRASVRPGRGVRPGSPDAAGADPKAWERRGARRRPRWRRSFSLTLVSLVASSLATRTDGHRAREIGRLGPGRTETT